MYIARIGLATGIIPALDMVGFSALLADTAMGLFGKHFFISIPKIAEGTTVFIRFRNVLPEQATSLFATITKHKRYNLACSPTQSDPQPMFVHFFQDK